MLVVTIIYMHMHIVIFTIIVLTPIKIMMEIKICVDMYMMILIMPCTATKMYFATVLEHICGKTLLMEELAKN